MRRSNISKLDRKLKLSLPVLILIIVLTLSVSTTVAFLIASTTPIENSFTPGKVTSAVQETFDGTIKSDVKIQNTGNVPAYIRAAVVVNWVNKDGNVCAGTHEAFTLPALGEKWIQGDDGYYYYSDPVEPNATTGNLFASEITMSTAADGCRLQIEIIGSAIQSEGTGAANAQEAWGKTPAASGN